LTGLVDLFYPALDALDAGLAVVLPPLGRLLVYGALSGVLTMVVYALVSNQDGIRLQKVRIKEIQLQLKGAKDDFAETMRLSRQNLSASMGLLGMSLWPALVASLPVLVLFAWLALRWSQPMPAPGTDVAVTATPGPATALTAAPPGALAQDGGGLRLRWPAPGAPVTLADGTGTVYEGLGARPAVSALHKHAWWNVLLGSPGGYLDDRSTLDEIRLAIPQREVLGFGPGWARGFELIYFLAVMVVSLAIKIVFKIA
jgi:hypothetical protein